jgi:hypothetical protein
MLPCVQDLRQLVLTGKVCEQGLVFMQEVVEETSTEPESLRIRGFTTRKKSGCSIHVHRGAVVLDTEEAEDVLVTFAPAVKRSPYPAQ